MDSLKNVQWQPASREALYAFGLHAAINYFKLGATWQSGAFAAIAYARAPDGRWETGVANATKLYLDVYLLIRSHQLITQMKLTQDLKSFVLGGATAAWAIGRVWDIKESESPYADKSALTKWLVSWGETTEGKDAKKTIGKFVTDKIVTPVKNKIQSFKAKNE